MKLIKSPYIVLALIVASGFIAPSLAQDEGRDYFILYDEGHGQFFTQELMSTALDSLKNNDIFGTNVNINIVAINDTFSQTNLQGADLLLITNPGYIDDNLADAKSGERSAINGFVDLGGSILYMSNPYSTNKSLAGHAETLNDLLVSDLRAIDTLGQDGDNTTILADAFANDGNETHVVLDVGNFQFDTLTAEPNNLENDTIIYYGAAIDDLTGLSPDFYGNGSENSFTIAKDYTVGRLQEEAHFMEANDDSGRTMLIGSTIMFSDYLYDSTTKWIDVASNLKLFQNMIAWLLKITPFEDVDPLVQQPWEYFLANNLLFAFAFSIGLGLLWFLLLLRKRRISLLDIFKVRVPKKKVSKDKKDTSKKSKPTTQQKKSRKRRKRT